MSERILLRPVSRAHGVVQLQSSPLPPGATNTSPPLQIGAGVGPGVDAGIGVGLSCAPGTAVGESGPCLVLSAATALLAFPMDAALTVCRSTLVLGGVLQLKSNKRTRAKLRDLSLNIEEFGAAHWPHVLSINLTINPLSKH